MAGGVGVLGPEGRSEGVNIPEGHGVGLTVELAAYGEAGGLSEKVLAEIHGPAVGLRDVVKLQGGHLEHLSGTFAVTGGDERSVHIDKIPLLEILMDGVGDQGADPEHGLEGVGPGPQVGDGP